MSDKPKKFGSANDKPKIVSLSDLKNCDDNCSSDDEKQTYYAGGEKSGTAVQGGGKKSKNFSEAQDIMSKIFAQASSEDPSKKDTNYFTGSGKKLNGISSSKKDLKHSTPEQDIITVDLIFWNDGFTVGEGPLRPYDDPQGLRLLDSIRNGTISANDLGIGPHDLADIKISQLPNENYSSDKKNQILKRLDRSDVELTKKPSFSGTGEKIGDQNTEIITIDQNAKLDPSVNTTRIQLVLPNGSRKVITISARAKISELYTQIKNELALTRFTLKLGNPAKLIPEDLDALIFQVGLLNASVIVSN